MAIQKIASFIIRALTPVDESILWKMLYHAIYVPSGQSPPDRGIIHQPELARYACGWGCQHDSGFIALAQSTGIPLGVAWLRLLTGENRGYGYIDDNTPELSIAVLPGYRGQGIGTALLSEIIQSARYRYPAVSLSVNSANPACRLYQRLGFQIIKRKEDDSLIMRKNLHLADRA